MNVYWIQQFWFDDFLETSGNLQRSYLTVDGFGIRNLAITAQVNVVAPGAHIEVNQGSITGDLGTAIVGKSASLAFSTIFANRKFARLSH